MPLLMDMDMGIDLLLNSIIRQRSPGQHLSSRSGQVDAPKNEEKPTPRRRSDSWDQKQEPPPPNQSSPSLEMFA